MKIILMLVIPYFAIAMEIKEKTICVNGSCSITKTIIKDSPSPLQRSDLDEGKCFYNLETKQMNKIVHNDRGYIIYITLLEDDIQNQTVKIKGTMSYQNTIMKEKNTSMTCQETNFLNSEQSIDKCLRDVYIFNNKYCSY